MGSPQKKAVARIRRKCMIVQAKDYNGKDRKTPRRNNHGLRGVRQFAGKAKPAGVGAVLSRPEK